MKKVLVVDDTKNIRTLLSTCLEMEGYEVTTADNGADAFRIFQTAEFDLAFLDIKLPELSGTEVLRRIRQAGLQTPVIIMTAFATVKNAVECTKLGAVAYLQKPFTAEKVRLTIHELEGNPAIYQHDYQRLLECGERLFAANKIEEAYQYFTQALAKNPCCGEIYERIGMVYQSKGEQAEADRFFEIAKKF